MKTLKKSALSASVVSRIDRAGRLTVALIAIAVIAISPLSAKEPSWYVGLGLGVGSYSESDTTALCRALGESCGTEQDDFNFKILGGYRFTRHISLDFGFSDWGEVSATLDGGANILAFNNSGIFVTAIPELPLAKHFSIFAELGFAYMTSEVKVLEALEHEDLIAGTVSKDVWSPIGGLGVAGNLKHWTFRLQWERINPDTEFDLGPFKIDAPSLDVYGITVIFRF